jgi:hypothetical protein
MRLFIAIGAVTLLRTSRRWFPFIERVFADTAYAGERVANAKFGMRFESDSKSKGDWPALAPTHFQ